MRRRATRVCISVSARMPPSRRYKSPGRAASGRCCATWRRTAWWQSSSLATEKPEHRRNGTDVCGMSALLETCEGPASPAAFSFHFQAQTEPTGLALPGLLVACQLGSQVPHQFPVLAGEGQVQRPPTRLDRIVRATHLAVDGAKHVVALPVPAARDLDGFLQLRNGIGEASRLR